MICMRAGGRESDVICFGVVRLNRWGLGINGGHRTRDEFATPSSTRIIGLILV